MDWGLASPPPDAPDAPETPEAPEAHGVPGLLVPPSPPSIQAPADWPSRAEALGPGPGRDSDSDRGLWLTWECFPSGSAHELHKKMNGVRGTSFALALDDLPDLGLLGYKGLIDGLGGLGRVEGLVGKDVEA